jgi:DNA-binding transcriptional LysR family regulator
VASLKSVTRAAEKLFLTQSAMSSRIASLETELGVLLLDRRDKQFRLTVAGARFFTYAQRLLELQREVKAEMGSGAPLAVSMRIGAIESVLHSWLIPWIEKLRADHPALELGADGGDHAHFGGAGGAGHARPGVCRVACGGRWRAHALLCPPMEMVFMGNAQLHRKRRYALADLGQGEVLTFQRGSQPHVTLLDRFPAGRRGAAGGCTPFPRFRPWRSWCKGGFGVATLPSTGGQTFAGCRLTLRQLPCDSRAAAFAHPRQLP